MRVLVVDDHRGTREALVKALSFSDCCARGAADAESAKALVHAAEWDLVVSDLRLPGESGLALVRYLRAQYPSLPICLMTGDSLREHEWDETATLSVTVLTKPVTVAELMACGQASTWRMR